MIELIYALGLSILGFAFGILFLYISIDIIFNSLTLGDILCGIGILIIGVLLELVIAICIIFGETL